MGNSLRNYQELAAACRAELATREDPRAIRIQVGSATCENAAGASEVLAELKKHVESSGRTDIVLRQTGCTGRCSCEPIVGVMVPGARPVLYQKVDRETVHAIFTRHVLGGTPLPEHVLDLGDQVLPQYDVLFCGGQRCGRHLETDLLEAFRKKLAASPLGASGRVRAVKASCFGLCNKDAAGKATHVLIRPSRVVYRVRTEADLDELIDQHLGQGKEVARLAVSDQPLGQRFFDLYGDVAFFHQQSRIALRNSGIVDPESLPEYVRANGFEALARVLEKGDPAAVIDEVSRSLLRGRGGGGYLTGRKWAAAAGSAEKTRYLICNADEGDPGAFMDRSMLEGDPFSVIEGMLIGAFAIGAHQGFMYVRAEYPMAIKRVQNAIDRCRERGLLGPDVLGSGFAFDLEIRLGAGAFVCGEETALIHSIEGERGQPSPRPPYPTEAGLWGKPTVINNVETFANVPVVLFYGADWFRQLGTEKSGGTKVFALAGKVRHTGLVEVPMGTPLREIVYGIGGGPPEGKRLKAVQTGGPAGGCIPAEQLDTPVDFDTLTAAGSIMGSGGMIVMDDDDCMVDLARFFLTFSQLESCGKCTPCREGTTRTLEILERLVTGKGESGDLEKLERLGRLMQKASLCGLGRAAPNPLLSTLKHYRAEYEAHLAGRCPAKRCASLIRYEIVAKDCTGCTACARACPASCIAGSVKKLHVIDQDRCIRCGRCFQVCRFHAVERA